MIRVPKYDLLDASPGFGQYKDETWRWIVEAHPDYVWWFLYESKLTPSYELVQALESALEEVGYDPGEWEEFETDLPEAR